MRGHTEERFNHLLVEAIGEGLELGLGTEGARSVTFYLDPHIAVADPDIYAASIAKILGTNADALLNAILDNLRRITGVPKGDSKSFGEGVADARRKFQQGVQTRI